MTMTNFDQYRTLAPSQDMIKPVPKSTKAHLRINFYTQCSDGEQENEGKKEENFFSMEVYRTLGPPCYNCINQLAKTDLNQLHCQTFQKYIIACVAQVILTL